MHVDHIIILLEIDVGTGKMELKSGRRSWQILLFKHGDVWFLHLSACVRERVGVKAGGWDQS